MEVNGHNFTIGADPEIFLGLGGSFVSAHDKIPGDKKSPFKVEKGAVQVDGMAAEFNIDPAENFKEFESNLNTVQSILKGMVGDHEFLNACSVNFDEKFLELVPRENLVLGCESDYNAWSGSENPVPDQSALMRTAGGHIHIGGFETDDPFNPVHFSACQRLAKYLDQTIGAYSILWDKDDKRRSMYGKAGAFRPKKYGMEYRTLSNSWLFSPRRVSFIYDGVVEALENMFSSAPLDERVQGIINNSDRESEFFFQNPKAQEVINNEFA